jgi:hypothetical protein
METGNGSNIGRVPAQIPIVHVVRFVSRLPLSNRNPVRVVGDFVDERGGMFDAGPARHVRSKDVERDSQSRRPTL